MINDISTQKSDKDIGNVTNNCFVLDFQFPFIKESCKEFIFSLEQKICISQ